MIRLGQADTCMKGQGCTYCRRVGIFWHLAVIGLVVELLHVGRTLVDRSMSRAGITTAHEKISRGTAEDDSRAHGPCHVGGLAAVIGTG